MTKAATIKDENWADKLLEDGEPKVSAKAARKVNNDFNRMPSGEVLARLYRRHSTGFWQTLTVVVTGLLVYTTV